MTEQQIKASLDQKSKIRELYNKYLNGAIRLGLFGKAGVGKTRSCSILVELIASSLNKKKKPINIIGVTVSHAAKNILNSNINFGRESDSIIPCYTLAAALNIKAVVNNTTGQIEFKSMKSTYIDNKGRTVEDKCKLAKADIIIIDEVSQINSKLYKLINDTAKNKAVIIYMGDHHQTPPVEDIESEYGSYVKLDTDSLAFNIPDKVYLTIPFRYEGDIQLLADEVANQIDSTTIDDKLSFFKKFTSITSDSYEFTRDKEYFFNSLIDDYKNNNDVNYSTLICYKNDTVDKYNTYIRNMLFDNSSLFEVNDFVICKDNSGHLINNGKYRVTSVERSKIYVITDVIGYTAKVTDVSSDIKSTDIVHIIDCFDIELDNLQTVKVVDVDYNYYNLLNTLSSNARKNSNWTYYYNVVKYFTILKHAYAVNTYVVQGSTYEKVYIDLRDIMNVKPTTHRQKLQSLYTAITRAKKKVTILV